MTKLYFDKIDSKLKNLSNMSDRSKLIWLTILGILIYILILKLNIISPMWSDDFTYTFIWGSNQKVSDINDIIISQYNHYYSWGGRVVAHFIAQFLLMLPAWLANVLNSLIYVLYSFLIYIHIKGNSKRQSLSIVILIFLLTWFYQPAYADTILWLTGSSNYLWCTTIVLLFFLPFRLYLDGGKRNDSLLNTLVLFLGGVLAGATNENVSPTVIIMICFFYLLCKKRNYKIPKWAISGMVGIVIGTVFLLVAPGNYLRLLTIGPENKSLFLYYFKFNLYSFRLFHHIGSLIIMASILIVTVLYHIKSGKNLFISTISLYTIGLFLPVYIMLASPEFPDRAYFFTVTNAIIVFGLAYYNLNSNHNFLRALKIVILSLFCFAFIFDFYINYKRIKMADIAWSERNLLIESQKNKGHELIEVSPIPGNGKFVHGDYILDFIPMSKYYDVKLIDKK